MKKIHFLVAPGIVLAVLSFLSVTLRAQSITPINATKSHLITSSFNHKVYEVWVSLPKHYTETDTLHYSVLYVLDGKYSFKSMSSIREVMDLGKEIKEIIIVSIDLQCAAEADWLASRHNDFTPSSIPQADTLWSKLMNIPEGKLKSGGAESFLNTLEKEVIPYIDSHYKTTADRGLSGHSLGGLFTGYCLLKRPTLFKRYGINSPSFWWNNREMMQEEARFSNQNTELPARVFFSIGGAEEAVMLSAFQAFTDSIKSRSLKDLSVTVKVFDGETHLSVVPSCNSRTLKVLYGSNVK
ncbi:MAG: alpha/beta hydrolase-fold protein [Spirosomataceae bacterium]